MNSTLTNSTLLEFKDSNFVFMMILMSTLFIQFSLGFSLNCYIIYILLARGARNDGSHVFILNCAVAEIIFSISSLLFVAILNHLFGGVGIFFMFVTSMSARLLFICCVCLKHYVAVVHPVTFLRLKPLRYQETCSVVVWIFSLLLGTVGYMLFSPYELLAVMFLIILAVEFFCCVAILRKLRDPGPRDMGREQGEMNAAKKKAFQIVFINLLTCLIQNIPIVVSYGLIRYLTPTSNSFTYKAEVISTVVNIIAGIVQPFFILHKAGKLSFIKCP